MRSPAPSLRVVRPPSPAVGKRPRNALLVEQLGLPPSLQDLAPDLEEAVNASGVASTTNGMTSAWAAWSRFCKPRGIHPRMRVSDPLRPVTLACFKVALVAGKVPPRPGVKPRSYSAATADVYASSVTSVHAMANPKEVLSRVTKGLKHTATKAPRPVLDLTLHQITVIVEAAMDDSCTSLREVRNAYVHLYLLLSMSRSEAATAKTLKDYSSEWDLCNAAVTKLPCRTVLKFIHKHGKSNAPGFRHGVGREYPSYVAGTLGSPLDPIALHDKYLRLRGEAPLTDPFFVQVTKSGLPTARPLTYHTYLKELRSDIRRCLPELVADRYGTHTFRRVAATIALMQGLPVDMIKLTGQWTSLSFERYYNLGDVERAEVAHFIASAPQARFVVKPATQETDRARQAYAGGRARH